uniref:Ubiquitin-like protease family profile domain-containing protein n=1 Tax=Panagrolaimus superbus TaxID=310955 RepID=A0A914YJE4_9BILA
MEIYKDNYDILLASIAAGAHWYLAAFFIETKMVVVYDSLHYPIPQIFTRLKSCIESVLHKQFTLKNENNNITLQQNEYDCGVHAFRNAEEICFHGECKLLVPYYAEAERARAREILRRLKDKEITYLWVPHVQSHFDYIDLNKPPDTVAEEVGIVKDDSDIQIIEKTFAQKNIATTVV